MYLQDSGPQGIVSIETENYDVTVYQGGHSWLEVYDSGYSGTAAMEASPNVGDNINTGYVSSSPRLDFQVYFVKTGTHYLWIRGIGASSYDDSCHVGLDGGAVGTSDRITGFGNNWIWTDRTIDGPVARIFISSAGLHTVNVWMREDGVVLDKLVLTTDSTYVPTGTGPNESPRELN